MEENPEDSGNKPIETKENPAVDESIMIQTLINQNLSKNQEKGKQIEICDTIVENENELNTHKKHTHGIMCNLPDCMIEVKKESDIKNHNRLYHSPRCPKCNNYSVNKFGDMYCRYCSSDLEKKYFNGQLKTGKLCVDCREVLANENDFKDHERIAHGTCKTCMMNLEGKKDLEVHKEIAHNFKCQKCGKICPTFMDLIEHHTKLDSCKQCDICHKDFKTNLLKFEDIAIEDFWEHKESHRNSKDNSFTCVTCGNKFLKFKQIAIHSLLHNTPAVIKGISRHKSGLLQSAMNLSNNKKNNNEKFSNSVKPKANNERISAYMNVETNKKEIKEERN